MLAKDKTNLKIEEIRMHKHHEIHRVKPLMPALCRIRQGKKVINWETHSLTVDNNQIILFPCAILEKTSLSIPYKGSATPSLKITIIAKVNINFDFNPEA